VKKQEEFLKRDHNSLTSSHYRGWEENNCSGNFSRPSIHQSFVSWKHSCLTCLNKQTLSENIKTLLWVFKSCQHA